MGSKNSNMKFIGFQVTNYRNIHDSGYIDVNEITAFVGQNEAGKSNLFDALYRVNPFISEDTYDLDEDWPVDDWGRKSDGEQVCIADFELTPPEIADLFQFSAQAPEEDEGKPRAVRRPIKLTLRGIGRYGHEPTFIIVGGKPDGISGEKVSEWAEQNVPKFVYIHDYDLSGARVELDQFQDRLNSTEWTDLSNEDQTIKIVLDLAKINIDEFAKKGETPEGRTVRSFDKRAASTYLSQQFSKLWTQKTVDFDIDIDGTTLNIFARDREIGMPVRLERRSTGFRWYVSFAWKFTHASGGEYKNCILLLEEPGIHLHYSGQRDLIDVFERLAGDNAILYTTHLASMVDLAHPERIRLVETHDHHGVVKKGVVSSQRAPMAVIELSLGLTGDMSSLLGNRQTLIVEGGDDALILHKLSGLLQAAGKESLSDRIYLWPARGASFTPMYAAFAIGQKWDAGVLLDTDGAGNEAKTQIEETYLKPLADADRLRFRVLMFGKSADIKKTDAAIEDIFPDQFYLDCVNEAYGIAVKEEDLPQDGSDMITKRVEHVLKNRHGRKDLDKGLVLEEMLRQFDNWNELKDLPKGTAARAEKLFATINRSFNPAGV